jgi:hypothetical protein
LTYQLAIFKEGIEVNVPTINASDWCLALKEEIWGQVFNLAI